MDEILSAFIGECNENIEKLDNELVMLEKQPDGPQVKSSLGNIFRTVHTIKGSCGWLGLSKLESVVHDGEDLLVCLREGQIPVTTEVVSALLDMFDAVREILAQIAATEQEGETDYSALIERLKQLQAPNAPESAAEAPAVAETPAPEAAMPAPLPAPAQPKSNGNKVPEPVQTAASVQTAPSVQAKAPKAQPDTQPDTKPEAKSSAQPEAKSEAKTSAQPGNTATHGIGGGKVGNSSIRVDVNVIDGLMNLVGELVLARNQILEYSQRHADPVLSASTQRLNLITSELQARVMKTRMQPISTIWSKFPRVARDLALDCGKQVELVMEGQETELDRTLIEAIKDPMTHLIRNAVDHGIESPAERAAAGKAFKGQISLRAVHEGGQMIITISDDGRGLSPERIRDKAIEKGLITAAEAAQMSERALQNLIFSAGFSTAEKVTNISGRGVGMDVVKHNIESVGGSIDLISHAGTGTTVKIKIPLTLAIIPALMVSCGNEPFAIPQVNVSELILLDGDEARAAIELIHETPVYRLRGRLLPLMSLSESLELGESFAMLRERLIKEGAQARLSIVVLQTDEQSFGVVVDRISDTAEIVVKPLSKQLKPLQIYAGATILGDGRIALILDVLGLARRAKLLADSQRQLESAEATLNQQDGHRQSMLLFQTPDLKKMALPLELVNRLETFEREQVEYAGKTQVIQYWNQILPLVDLDEALSGQAGARSDKYLNVVVCKDQERYAGIVVDKILDIVETDADHELQQNVRRQGVKGTMILQGAVTELLDFEDVTRRQVPSFYGESPWAQPGPEPQAEADSPEAVPAAAKAVLHA